MHTFSFCLNRPYLIDIVDSVALKANNTITHVSKADLTPVFSVRHITVFLHLHVYQNNMLCPQICVIVRYQKEKNLREERFSLTPSFRGFSPSWHRGYDRAEQLTRWWPRSRDQARKRPGATRTYPSGFHLGSKS
jgi:hypothetical protein